MAEDEQTHPTTERTRADQRAALKEAERLRVVEMLTDPKPPLRVSDLMMLAEQHLCLAAGTMAEVKDGADQDRIVTALALSQVDTALGRGFVELADLKHKLGLINVMESNGRAPWRA
jgi:hypothetical protein